MTKKKRAPPSLPAWNDTILFFLDEMGWQLTIAERQWQAFEVAGDEYLKAQRRRLAAVPAARAAAFEDERKTKREACFAIDLFLVAVGRISLLLRPAPRGDDPKREARKARGKRLRELLGVVDGSKLDSKSARHVRNVFAHFDEHLDDACERHGIAFAAQCYSSSEDTFTDRARTLRFFEFDTRVVEIGGVRHDLNVLHDGVCALSEALVALEGRISADRSAEFKSAAE